MISPQFKERMDKAYRSGEAPWDTRVACGELTRRFEANELPQSGKAVDLGCGTGTQTLQLAELGYDVVGVDLSELAIEEARRRAAEHAKGERARFVAGDLTQVRGIGEPFDLVFDRGCYHLMRRENLEGYLEAVEALTQKGSIALILAFNAHEPQEHEELPVVTEEQIRGELGRVFEFRDLRPIKLEKPKSFEREPAFWSALLVRR